MESWLIACQTLAVSAALQHIQPNTVVTMCVAVGMQAKAVRCKGTAHGFMHFNSLVEIECAKAALEHVTDALRQAASGDFRVESV